MLQALQALHREYQAARVVLREQGPPNWAKLLSDFRSDPSRKRKANLPFHELAALCQRDDATDTDILQALVEALRGIVPEYPSQAGSS
jgi:hypothetical protein